ncbi:MAG: ORF6N domain-containing protein [Burkholderiales bacterium]
MPPAASRSQDPLGHIENRILLVRGRRVLIDVDLAALYGVQTRALNQAVKRNAERFPADFMFRLSSREFENWRSQSVISNPGAKMGLRRAPLAFTEHGALMAATVLDSAPAVQASLYVVRAFVQLRQFLASHKDLARRLAEHEKRLSTHDQAIAGLFETIRQLMAPPASPRRRPIGFVTDNQKRD